MINLKKTIAQYELENNINEVLGDFYAYIKGENTDNLNASGVKKIYEWFEDEYRPQVISNNVLKSLKAASNINEDHYSKLIAFHKICTEFGSIINQLIGREEYNFEKKLVEDILEFNRGLLAALEKIEIVK